MKRITRFSKRTWVLFGVVAAVAAMATVGAYAYWTQGGSGTGSATTGTTTAITVVQDSTTASSLYPGGPSEVAERTLREPEPGRSEHLVRDGGGRAVLVAGRRLEAGLHARRTSRSADPPGRTSLPPATRSTWSGLNVSLLNGAGNQDNCKSVSITINYTANP